MNGHISATGRPIHSVFGARVGFSGSADRMALLPVGPDPRRRPAAILENCEWPYLCNGFIDPLRVWCFGVSAAGFSSLYDKWNNSAVMIIVMIWMYWYRI